MKEHTFIGACLIGVAAYIATGWLLCRILGVCEREMDEALDFEKLRTREREKDAEEYTSRY